ncbi:hypothetical protein C900_02091 [Fulvivirga imtechensis AK7]|uniref:eCIS core domain-containing protein n=1 Tax=Fulvivirga imtechensis AK7 TaxID=1237149 RepID=L8K2K8_9BACT|nr:DUF4157 domain-containing protein [Fulvivirga imtechensis]ELR73687.1 hypothetical protein C900_02091 [Fulvivirga imtechensis AK7]
MNIQTKKSQVIKSQPAANRTSPDQRPGGTSSFVDNRPEAIAQRKLQQSANNSPQVKQVAQLQAVMHDQQKPTLQKKENNTGLPDQLKSGIESLSGYAMDDVKVHYNSDKPSQLQAHAYAQGTEIHIAPGQEKHLPHEAWHVVQQKQGRVKPTTQLQGKINVNDDAGLEKEADVMGAKASAFNVAHGESLELDTNDQSNVAQNRSWTIRTGIAQLSGKVVQFYQPGQEEVGQQFQIQTSSGWTVGTLDGISTGGFQFTTREGVPVVIPHDEHERIRPTVGFTSPSGMDLEESSTSNPSKPYPSMQQEYTGWTPEMTHHEVSTPFGPINVRHNRKAPYITTNTTQYPDTSVRVDYKDIVTALRKEGIGDSEIAEILLMAKEDGLTNPNAIRAAAMLIAVVYLAEEWRKQGAAKIFRAILRLIVSGKLTLSDIPRVFEFVSSAKKGREQVARIHQVLSGKLSVGSLDEEDQAILGAMSPLHHGDVDSDDDLRDIKEKDFKHGRAWGEHGEKARKEKIDPKNIFKINGVFYNIADPRIAHDGQCLWDTLELFGVARAHLQNAAANIDGVGYGGYVDVDQLRAIVGYLNANGYSLRLELNTFGYDGKPGGPTTVIGDGANTFRLGLVYDPINGLGHFIPALN